MAAPLMKTSQDDVSASLAWCFRHKTIGSDSNTNRSENRDVQWEKSLEFELTGASQISERETDRGLQIAAGFGSARRSCRRAVNSLHRLDARRAKRAAVLNIRRRL